MKYLLTLILAVLPALGAWKYEPMDAAAFDRKFAGGRLAGQGAVVNEVCKAHNVDPKLLSSIMAHESTWGKSPLAKLRNNFGGLKAKKGWMSFKSPREGIEYMAGLLSRRYRGQSLGAMERRYAGGTRGWSRSVAKIMAGM